MEQIQELVIQFHLKGFLSNANSLHCCGTSSILTDNVKPGFKTFRQIDQTTVKLGQWERTTLKSRCCNNSKQFSKESRKRDKADHVKYGDYERFFWTVGLNKCWYALEILPVHPHTPVLQVFFRLFLVILGLQHCQISANSSLKRASLQKFKSEKHILQQWKPTNTGSVLIKITMPV